VKFCFAWTERFRQNDDIAEIVQAHCEFAHVEGFAKAYGEFAGSALVEVAALKLTKRIGMTQTTSQNKPPRLWRMFLKVQNPFMKWLLRSPFHIIVSRMYLLITFTGHKSGAVYATPVQYSQQGEMLYIITSEGYTWWKNLRGGAKVQVYMRGKSYPGHAEISTDLQMISAFLQKIYPRLRSEKRTRFAAGKVAITVALQGEIEGAK